MNNGVSSSRRTTGGPSRVAPVSAGRGSEGADPGRRSHFVRRALRSPYARIWVLTAILFVASAVFVPGTVASTALLSMLPFAAILALAAAGQALVIQQGGIDLSSAGVVSVTAVVIVTTSRGTDSRLLPALLVAVATALAAGLVNGLAVSVLAVPPLIATLAMNALLTGVVFYVTGGNIASAAPPALTNAVSAKVFGIQVVTWVPIVAVVIATVILHKTVAGRRLEAVGAAPATARAIGLNVVAFRAGAYVLAALAYAGAGTLLTGFVARPDLLSGDDYLLLTIAAVAIGGASLGGGRTSLIATAVGALFLTQLDQVVRAAGAPAAMQYVIQGIVLILGIGIRGLRFGGVTTRARRLWPTSDAPGSSRGAAL